MAVIISAMPVDTLGGSVAGVSLLAMVFSLLHVAVAVGCAMAIAEANRRMEAQGRKPELLSSLMWVLAGLVGGVVTLVIYWAMHFSTLSRSGWVDRN
jgi:hypothetical protein